MKTKINILLRNIFRRLGGAFTSDIDNRLVLLIKMYQELCINQLRLGSSLYQDPKRLMRYEYQVFSQSGEDGIIHEIFKRIGETNRYFVEFGVGDGLESNTASLLLKGWRGLWIEGDSAFSKTIRENLKKVIGSSQLHFQNLFVTPDNIETFFREAGVPREFDLLSIDIDGNDFWVWKAVQDFSPRVVVIEYNAALGPDFEWVMDYNPDHFWDSTANEGASLKSLEMLGAEKGYRLVGCNLIGVNAFFIREDLLGDNFAAPFMSENHFEPPRYFLKRNVGHPRSFKMFNLGKS